MSYSIIPVLHDYADKQHLHQVLIRVIHQRKKTYIKTGFKVKAEQFSAGKVINHPHKVKINATINRQLSEIEERLIDMIRKEDTDNLKEVVSGKKSERKLLTDFIREFVEEVRPLRSKATIQVYLSLATDLDEYDSKLFLDKINLSILNNFTKQQAEKWEHNTVNKKIKHLKAFLNRAYERQLINLDQFIAFKVPTYIQKIPTYITENEMASFKEVCDSIKQPQMKMSGYYFLLSCYAGYRISDLKRFNHKEFVKGKKIVLAAKKNKEIVSIPIHTRLQEILDYCKENPMTIAEQNMRDYVKQIAKLAGINKDLRVHDGRHSFAMMLMERGFDTEEVAELLGITPKVAKVYARITNKRLEGKVIEKLG
jgi:site-specific recombinase XerD